ncbi:MAG: protein-export membrane protein SecF [Bdellovibrionales bacterium GWB1_55_8]|nr:MAG: protein-export membrane protein SecF [Bdellovibrionales bacterium GWB1_55_8]
MFQLIRPDTNYDFVGKRFIWAGISGAAVLLTIVLFFTKGLNYGIDFTGGAEVQVRVPQNWEIGMVRSAIEQGGLEGARVQQIGEPAAHEFLIKAQGDASTLNQVSGQVEAAISKQLKPGEYEIQRVDVVGPAAGKSLRMSGFLSMFYALLAILIYVGIRFDIRYAPGLVVALFHDAIIVIGIFIVTGKQFDLQILAALLALIGYSCNDTIVIYDRIREVLQIHPGMKIEVAVNKAVNETLGRSILTSVVTLLTVVALLFFGGNVIHDFAFALTVGIIAGCYSTIFVASPFVIAISNYYDKRLAKQQGSSGGPGGAVRQPKTT